MASSRRFEDLVLPWLDAGYNLARWLLRDASAAEDVVQEASLRAFRHLDGLRGDDARPWFLRIVRNACFAWIEARQANQEVGGWEDEQLEQLQASAGQLGSDPLAALDRAQTRRQIDQAIRDLSPLLREVVVLREIEGLEYTEIAAVASIPVGTVMSRLSRARERLRIALTVHADSKPRENR